MIINKQKKIGQVVIFTEGENPEFEIIENIFNKLLGYSIIKKSRNDKEITELIGYDNYSKILLLNAPTSNINSISNELEFLDFIFNEYALTMDIDTINNPVYFIFDRDPENNRQGLVEKLLKKLTNSQNDTEEQNGLLLLNYPSIESFILSLNENNSYKHEEKEYIQLNSYTASIDETNFVNAINNFIEYLKSNSIINNPSEVKNELDSLGINIFNKQKQLYNTKKVFSCVSQLIEILIDLQIIVL